MLFLMGTLKKARRRNPSFTIGMLKEHSIMDAARSGYPLGLRDEEADVIYT